MLWKASFSGELHLFGKRQGILLSTLIAAVIVMLAGAMSTLSAQTTQLASQPAKDPTIIEYANRIDELVFGKLEQLGISPSELCSDEVFLRRLYIDVIGTLPTAGETRSFLRSTKPDKRAALIDELLQRDEFADYWSLKWCDLLRVKSEFPSKLWPNAVQAYHRWIRTAIRQNMPYDTFARELLTSTGSNFRVPQVNFFRAIPTKDPHKIAEAVSLSFMGIRPETWTERQRMGMAAFFARVGYKPTSEWKEEIIYFDPNGVLLNPKTKRPLKPKLPHSRPTRVKTGQDPRIAFADWLTGPDNPYFARCAVNRIWCWLLGRGIIHEPDDIRPDNPPQNPELLGFLEKELINHKFDLKHIYRLILNSRTYQLSARHTPDNAHDRTNFSHYYLRRLEAEVLIDAICQVTATREGYSSKVPEPFTHVPSDQRSITLSDGSITSPFLEKFGRPSRDTGYESERNNTPSAAQRLHLLNSTHIQRKLEKSRWLRRLANNSKLDNDATVRALYVRILSRYPTDVELETAGKFMESSGLNKRQTVTDLAWALINTREFRFRH